MFVSVKIDDLVTLKGSDPVAALAKFGLGPCECIGMSKFAALQCVLIEVMITPDERVFKIMPDARSPVQCTNNDTERDHCEQQHEIPARENGEEAQPIKDRRKRAIARKGILLHPGSISNRITKD